MCTPKMGIDTFFSGFKLLQDSSTVFNSINQNKKNTQYRMQIALANARESVNEANRQRQQGIESSRLKKIEGIKEVNKEIAMNASSGFDVNSQTFQYNNQDILDTSYSASKQTENEYNKKASDYFQNAMDYINQADSLKNNYNSSVVSQIYTALGQTKNAASKWYT